MLCNDIYEGKCIAALFKILCQSECKIDESVTRAGCPEFYVDRCRTLLNSMICK